MKEAVLFVPRFIVAMAIMIMANGGKGQAC